MTDPLPRRAGRVVLRRLAATDLGAFQAYRHDPEVARFQGWVPTRDEHALEFLTDMSVARLLQPGVWCQIGIADGQSGHLIGDIGLNLASDARQAEIGFSLRRESQGRGLATDAIKGVLDLIFEATPAHRILGIADQRNTPSIRLLERVGMHRIGTQDAMSLGEPYTEWIYAIDKASNG